MSNGTLAELPPENKPDFPDTAPAGDASVMLLLPHNKYLLGSPNGKWVYASFNDNGQKASNVFLYENEALSLINEGTTPTIIPAGTVNILRKELFSLSEPPGHHTPTVLMLKTFMKDNPVFNDDKFLDEKIFSGYMKNDFTLFKAYWALRFSLARNELETAGRLKAWLKAGPNIFQNPHYVIKIYFSLTKLPDGEAVKELMEQYSFSHLELERIGEQQFLPLVVYNPLSGRLIVGQFGRKRDTNFRAWIYLSHDLYHELRHVRKLTLHDIIQAVWAEHETRQAMEEREKYKKQSGVE